ncbi:unnamed protein product [Allacma fusca]|uniref:Uncharacterized protein n=1 Tax=Allacma fusca TaxID=39272 RepID=A0A8J2KJY6_9HEXA|nr:unnamed protein product [Allacma fusca]
MGLWKSKNPAPSRKRSILKSPKGKPAKVAFHIDKAPPKSHPSTPKRKSSGTKKFIKTDAKTGPSQVCFREDVVEGDGTPINESRKSNKSVLCRSSGEIHEHGCKSRKQSKTKTEESTERPKVLHGKKSYLEDKTCSIYAWLEQSEKAMKKCSSTSKQSLERDLTSYTSKKIKSRAHLHSNSGDEDGSNKAQISDTIGHDPDAIALKKMSSHRNPKERTDYKSKAPRVAQTKKESIDMDKVIKQRIFNALDKRELRFAAKKQLTYKKAISSKVENPISHLEESRRVTRHKTKALHPTKSKHMGAYERSKRQVEPEKRLARRSRRDLKSRQSSNESPIRIHRSRSRKSRKKTKRSRSKKVRKAKIRSKSKARNESEVEVSEDARTIKFAKTPKKSKLITEPDKDADRADIEENPPGHSTDDVPEARSMTDLRHVPVFAYTEELSIPIIDERRHNFLGPSFDSQGDGLPTGLSRRNQNNANSNQNPQNRGDDLTRFNIDFSLIKCSARKQIREKTFLPGIPNRRLNTRQSSICKENVCLHRTKNDTDITDGKQLLRRSKPCTSLVENSKPIPTNLEKLGFSPCVSEVDRTVGKTSLQNPPEGAEAGEHVGAILEGIDDPPGNDFKRNVLLPEIRILGRDAGDMREKKFSNDEPELNHDHQQKSLSPPTDAVPSDVSFKKIDNYKRPFKMQPLLPQNWRLSKGSSKVPKHKNSIESSQKRDPSIIKQDSKQKANIVEEAQSPSQERITRAQEQSKLLREWIKNNRISEGFTKETIVLANPSQELDKKELPFSNKKNAKDKKDHQTQSKKKDPHKKGKKLAHRKKSPDEVKKSPHSNSKNKSSATSGSKTHDAEEKRKSKSDKSDKNSAQHGDPADTGNAGDKSKAGSGGSHPTDHPDHKSDGSGSGPGSSFSLNPSIHSPVNLPSGDEKAKSEETRPKTGKSEAGKSEAGKSEAGKSGTGKSETSKSEAAKTEPTKSEVIMHDEDQQDYNNNDEIGPVGTTTTTTDGGICFKLPGRVTHKTTIKVAHFPRSDPICINIPPPPNPPCCCPPPWCCPPCCCPNPCCPNPCCKPDPCNPYCNPCYNPCCPCGCCPPGTSCCPPGSCCCPPGTCCCPPGTCCCPPGTCCCPPGGGRLLNNCNIYNGRDCNRPTNNKKKKKEHKEYKEH